MADFKSLLEEMSAYPMDYMSELITNTVEGFHGLPLV